MHKKIIIKILTIMFIAVCFFIINDLNNNKAEAATLENGIYEVETAVDKNKALDVICGYKNSGANVQIYSKNNAKCQKVEVVGLGNDYYTLKFVHSGKMLDVAYSGKANGTNVWQCNKNGCDAQKWLIKKTSDGYYTLMSKCNGSYLTVHGDSAANCTNVEINAYNGGKGQKFKFNKNVPITGTKTVADGIYEIETATSSNKALDVICAYQNSGANVQIYTKNNAKCQKVQVKYVGNGYYTLKFIHSGKMLDLSYSDPCNGNNVWQCNNFENDAQKWVIKSTGDRIL